MTLREQIKAIHASHFNKELHEHRGHFIPAMVDDLALKLFDDLALEDSVWALEDSADIRAIKHARKLVNEMNLRKDTPAVE